MRFSRSAGVLLHISSLPGAHGIGDLGDGAYAFVDWLAKAGQRWWQILPLGPPDKDNNLYSAQSSWAGSPLFVNLDRLADKGDLKSKEAGAARVDERSKIHYRRIRVVKEELLSKAAARFFKGDSSDRDLYEQFCQEHHWWLNSWALFAAAKQVSRGKVWWCWRDLADCEHDQLVEFAEMKKEEIAAAKYIQFRFFQQWEALRAYAAERGVKFIGDVPIYCAADSQDVWSRQEMFKLNDDGTPRAQSGVPPDYFSNTGQLWGHPVYDWQQHYQDGFRWWISRLKGCLATVDAVRIDHFRGLESYWEIPGDALTAEFGRWQEGPGDRFFEAVSKEFGEAPFIAEDLGIITPEVDGLRERWGLPGMRVLQFAFGGDSRNGHLPHWYPRHCVVYSGTHDNDTTRGWYGAISSEERLRFQRYSGSSGRDPHYHLIRLAYSSVADLAVVPMQDVLGLGTSARLNLPGSAVPGGNYRWKLVRKQLSQKSAQLLRGLVELFSRQGE